MADIYGLERVIQDSVLARTERHRLRDIPLKAYRSHTDTHKWTRRSRYPTQKCEINRALRHDEEPSRN